MQAQVAGKFSHIRDSRAEQIRMFNILEELFERALTGPIRIIEIIKKALLICLLIRP